MILHTFVDEILLVACRYSRGQKFGKHVDDSVEVAPGQFTGYTVLIYLSGNVRSKNDSEQVTSAPSSSSSKRKSRPSQEKSSASAGQGAAAAVTGSLAGSSDAVQPLIGGETIFYGAWACALAAGWVVACFSWYHCSCELGCLDKLLGIALCCFKLFDQNSHEQTTASLDSFPHSLRSNVSLWNVTGARGRVVASVAPVPGLALLHLHGEDDCLEHEAAEVQQGVKYVLRSDVVFALPGRAHE